MVVHRPVCLYRLRCRLRARRRNRGRSDADETCDFCGSSPAAPLNSLLAVFVDGLRNEYGTADNEGIFYDGREGGYQWDRTWDTWDLVVYGYADVLTGDGLAEAVQRAVQETTWVERNPAWPRPGEALGDAWDQFCETVKHETRYVLWLRDDIDLDEARRTGEVPPALVLQEIGRLLERMDVGLHTLPAGYGLWRARTHPVDKIPATAGELGTPSRADAKQANRMSPAGIPMFYGAAERTTAIREVAVRSKHGLVTSGWFETSRQCTVVDFTRLPETPSMFDPEWGAAWRYLRFLNSFAAALSKPARNTYEQIDYVPTQIVTEYLLRIFLGGRGVRTPVHLSAYRRGVRGPRRAT